MEARPLRALLRELIDSSLRESIDTTTPGGKLEFRLFGAVAEFGRT